MKVSGSAEDIAAHTGCFVLLYITLKGQSELLYFKQLQQMQDLDIWYTSSLCFMDNCMYTALTMTVS